MWGFEDSRHARYISVMAVPAFIVSGIFLNFKSMINSEEENQESDDYQGDSKRNIVIEDEISCC